MKNLIKVFVLASALVSTSGYGGDTVIGAGTNSCGAWTKAIDEDPSLHSQRQVWVLGFLSGVNAIWQKDILVEYDGEDLIAWIDNYCKENPLDRIASAASSLVRELDK